MLRHLLFLALSACLISSCSNPSVTENNPETTTENEVSENKVSKIKMRIQAYLLPGTIEGHMMSLVAQEGDKIGSDDWSLLFTHIQGFSFEPGYICDLVIKKEQLAQVPADHIGVRYTLLKLEKKEKAPADLTFSMDLYKDYLRKDGDKYSILTMPFDCGKHCEELSKKLVTNNDKVNITCKWSDDFKTYVLVK